MKLLMLCREPRLYSCQRLKEAAESCGHQMDILDPNRCILKLDKNPPHFSLYYQQNAESEPYLLPDYDAVLPRFGRQAPKWAVRYCVISKERVSIALIKNRHF